MRLIDPEQITKMMSDLYISEDAVNMTGERQGLWVRFRAIEKAVSEIPTIDAVQVVRCKDCRHSRIEGDATLFMWCGYWNKPTDGNRYCSDGEEKG